MSDRIVSKHGSIWCDYCEGCQKVHYDIATMKAQCGGCGKTNEEAILAKQALDVAKELEEQDLRQTKILKAADALVAYCHGDSQAAGWWTDIKTGEPLISRPHVVGEKLMLIVSEVAEAMEGHRKNLMDDKLLHRRMFEVEMADALIRIFDLCGAMGVDIGPTIHEKLEYNKVRPDHKKEARLAEGGKQY